MFRIEKMVYHKRFLILNFTLKGYGLWNLKIFFFFYFNTDKKFRKCLESRDVKRNFNFNQNRWNAKENWALLVPSKDMQTPPLRSGHIYMKDARNAASNEKSCIRFFRFLFFVLWLIAYTLAHLRCASKQNFFLQKWPNLQERCTLIWQWFF